MGQAEGVQSSDGRAVPRDDLRCDRASSGDADLLADDSPHASLEWIPGAGRAKSGTGEHERTDDSVADEVSGCGLHVCVEVEDASSALNHMDQALPVGQVGAEQ